MLYSCMGMKPRNFAATLKDKVTVIKAFGLTRILILNELKRYAESVDYFLFDTKTDKHGGSGQTFDWSLLDKYKLDIPFLFKRGIEFG